MGASTGDWTIGGKPQVLSGKAKDEIAERSPE
jgi:hypothetical protein